MSNNWYVAVAGQQRGPIPGTEVKQLVRTGQIGPDDLVWQIGMPNWVPAKHVKGMFPALLSVDDSSPPPLPSSVQAPAPTPEAVVHSSIAQHRSPTARLAKGRSKQQQFVLLGGVGAAVAIVGIIVVWSLFFGKEKPSAQEGQLAQSQSQTLGRDVDARKQSSDEQHAPPERQQTRFAEERASQPRENRDVAAKRAEYASGDQSVSNRKTDHVSGGQLRPSDGKENLAAGAEKWLTPQAGGASKDKYGNWQTGKGKSGGLYDQLKESGDPRLKRRQAEQDRLAAEQAASKKHFAQLKKKEEAARKQREAERQARMEKIKEYEKIAYDGKLSRRNAIESDLGKFKSTGEMIAAYGQPDEYVTSSNNQYFHFIAWKRWSKSNGWEYLGIVFFDKQRPVTVVSSHIITDVGYLKNFVSTH